MDGACCLSCCCSPALWAAAVHCEAVKCTAVLQHLADSDLPIHFGTPGTWLETLLAPYCALPVCSCCPPLRPLRPFASPTHPGCYTAPYICLVLSQFAAQMAQQGRQARARAEWVPPKQQNWSSAAASWRQPCPAMAPASSPGCRGACSQCTRAGWPRRRRWAGRRPPARKVRAMGTAAAVGWPVAWNYAVRAMQPLHAGGKQLRHPG